MQLVAFLFTYYCQSAAKVIFIKFVSQVPCVTFYSMHGQAQQSDICIRSDPDLEFDTSGLWGGDRVGQTAKLSINNS